MQGDPADLSSSTPSSFQNDHRRQDGQYVLPEQMGEIILALIAQVTSASARSRSPTSFFDARQNIGEDFNRNDTTPKEVPLASYKNTTSVSCDL